jgi:hypothetical protein
MLLVTRHRPAATCEVSDGDCAADCGAGEGSREFSCAVQPPAATAATTSTAISRERVRGRHDAFTPLGRVAGAKRSLQSGSMRKPSSDAGVDLDGRVFRSPDDVDGGQVTPETEFRFRQSSDMVWGRYSGGSIRMGFFVGTSDGETVRFRYTQLDTTGETASGSSVDRIEVLTDGRVRLHESWTWDSKQGSGTSVLEEEA